MHNSGSPSCVHFSFMMQNANCRILEKRVHRLTYAVVFSYMQDERTMVSKTQRKQETKHSTNGCFCTHMKLWEDSSLAKFASYWRHIARPRGNSSKASRKRLAPPPRPAACARPGAARARATTAKGEQVQATAADGFWRARLPRARPHLDPGNVDSRRRPLQRSSASAISPGSTSPPRRLVKRRLYSLSSFTASNQGCFCILAAVETAVRHALYVP